MTKVETRGNSELHPTSIVRGRLVLHDGAYVGPYCLIQGDVEIGAGTVIEGHVTLGSAGGVLRIGELNKVSPGAVIGGPPQDLTYKGENTELIIGDRNTFREFSTVNLATSKAHKVTRVGNDCYLMSYTHVGHDCVIGNHVVIANDSHLGGHTEIEDHVVIGGVCAFNQNVRVGKFAFVAGSSAINKDIVPFSRAQGNYALVRATNKVGLARNGFSRETILAIHRAIRFLVTSQDPMDQTLKRIETECLATGGEQVQYLLHFIRNSKRGIAIARGAKALTGPEVEED